MEVYLNSIEMGNNIYGVSACAEYNFDKTAAALFALAKKRILRATRILNVKFINFTAATNLALDLQI